MNEPISVLSALGDLAYETARSYKKSASSSATEEEKEDKNKVHDETCITYADVERVSSTEQESPASLYPGDLSDSSGPLKDEYEVLEFPSPAVLMSFYNRDIAEGHICLHKWQVEELEKIGAATPTSQHPYKTCLCANNGSGKDSIIIASFACWFALTKKRARAIVTSASGTQLTAQTENPLRELCQMVNNFHGVEIFRIRQRYIKCMLSGSEIRLFATDEKGRAEGYHPIVPGAAMAIVVSEGKTVTDDIHNALRRCTGFNYWLEVSTPGEPKGFFYRAFTTWTNTCRVTTYECPHLSMDELEEDKREWGEHSALFRSKHLALFTTLGGTTVIPVELVSALLKKDKESFTSFNDWPTRVGIDLAAGGDENVICFTKGASIIKEVCFREVDTTITADRINHELIQAGISKSSSTIYADDGGVGHGTIDQLCRMGWDINRVLNQWAAINKKQFGNRGAENWYRCKRILEESLFDISKLSTKTIEQLSSRHYKQQLTGGRIFLQPKKEAIAEGLPSPDRADAFILSLTGLTVDSFLQDSKVPGDARPKTKLSSMQEIAEYYENEVTFGSDKKRDITHGNVYNSLQVAVNRTN